MATGCVKGLKSLYIISNIFYCTCSPFAFARFSSYNKAENAYTSLDGKDFFGLRLFVCFSKSSIVTEDDYRKQRNIDPFKITVTDCSRQTDGQYLSSVLSTNHRVTMITVTFVHSRPGSLNLCVHLGSVKKS